MSESEITHEGVIRRSGRYPWGSGDNPYQRTDSLLAAIEKFKSEGMSDVEIAKALGMSTTQLRARKSIAKNEQRKSDASFAQRLKEKGMSNVAIAERMGIGESQVRNLLEPSDRQKQDAITVTTDILKKNVDAKQFIDVGVGVENQLAVSSTTLKAAVTALQDQGYVLHNISVEQLGTQNQTVVKVLTSPGTKVQDVYANRDKIGLVQDYTEDNGATYQTIKYPVSIDSKRLAIRYGDEGGSDRDGMIELRRGVDDISMGQSRYAQVRIAVDGTHYIKGMAVYSDDLPAGVDIRFNTNKDKKANKLAALKPLEDDPDLPMGAVIKYQRTYTDKNGKKQQSSLNILREEGDWDKWSKNLSSQMLSKQSPVLAKEQLQLSYKLKKAEFDEIMALTNPVVKKKLLESFADGCDSDAVHLKAAAMPRQKTQVILPVPSMKSNEIYAPNFRNGEAVVLIRYPHGGKFEIPELRVNNRHQTAKKLLGDAIDAVGINSKVAEHLSGADFDGDFVLVIPNSSKKIKNSSKLEQLKDFDPKRAYPHYEGMKRMTPAQKGMEMGLVSNLITDMTIKGATQDEIARAVRHSMVVIDAEKHNLNYRQSAKDNGIPALRAKYQGGTNKGASTLISKSSSEVRVRQRKARPSSEGGPIDPLTGEKKYVGTGKTYIDKKGNVQYKTQSSTKMAEAKDAKSLSSGTLVETVYANHANQLKMLGNQSRKISVGLQSFPYSPSAKRTYSKEVSSLKAKLNLAYQNKPLERRAQLVAHANVQAKVKANPGLDKGEVKKLKGKALIEARRRVGASKYRVVITPKEWEAIQAGAITANHLTDLLNQVDLDQVKALATPRTTKTMSAPNLSRAKAMASAGYTQSEIADLLGVSTSTISSAIRGEE